MSFRNEVPLFRPLILFIAGILTANYLTLFSPRGSVIVSLGLASLLLLQHIFRRKLFTRKTRWTTGVIVALLSLSAGYSITLLNTESS